MGSRTLERVLAALLGAGTWTASALLAAGLTLGLMPGAMQAPAFKLAMAGIALLILLPVLRVMTMGAIFLYRREYLFGSVAVFVLSMLIGCFWLALRTGN